MAGGRYCVGCEQDYTRGAACPACNLELVDKATLDSTSEFNPDDLVGKDMRNCRMVSVLGRGSMGVVFEGFQVALNRRVALKLIKLTRKNLHFAKRLLSEARIIAQLEHPNLVQIYDAGISRGFLFLMMQLLQGEPLRARVGHGRKVSPDEAVPMVDQIARGLAAAHSKGVVHRDLKPENIMLVNGSICKIMDFGVALDVKSEDDLSGCVVGTQYYISPEAWTGHECTPRSDLYALGVIFFEMLTGSRPFEVKDPSRIAFAHLNLPVPPPNQVVREIPDDLSAIVLKLLAKDPGRRYRDSGELLSDLSRFMQKGDVQAHLEQIGQVECRFCGTPNPANQGRCRRCDEPVAKASALALDARDNEFQCGGCRRFVQVGSHACPACMRPVCRTCRRASAENGPSCSACASAKPVEENRGLFKKIGGMFRKDKT